MGDAMSQHPGLSRTGARQHQERSLPVDNRFSLGRVELGEESLDSIGPRLGGGARGFDLATHLQLRIGL